MRKHTSSTRYPPSNLGITGDSMHCELCNSTKDVKDISGPYYIISVCSNCRETSAKQEDIQ